MGCVVGARACQQAAALVPPCIQAGRGRRCLSLSLFTALCFRLTSVWFVCVLLLRPHLNDGWAPHQPAKQNYSIAFVRAPKCRCSLGTTAARPRAADGAGRSVAASPSSPRASRGASLSSSRPRRCSVSPPRPPARAPVATTARMVAATGSRPAVAAERRHRGS